MSFTEFAADRSDIEKATSFCRAQGSGYARRNREEVILASQNWMEE